jgi:murein DD-endopeptidase MepM/ murein hydrolase activator NlpD
MSGRRPRTQARPRMQARPMSAMGEPPRSGAPAPRRTVTRVAALAIVVGAVVLGLLGLSTLVGASPTPTAPPSASLASPSTAPATPTASAPPTASPTVAPTPSPSASTSPSPAGGLVAPSSAEGFDIRTTAIDIAFPIRPSVRYRYTDDFLVPRVGVTRRYNHARGESSAGRLLRAHDGIDIRAKLRTRLHAAFSGTVIDPAERWTPWEPQRYGNVVVIVSDEPSSLGYAALYAHLSSARVEVGDHVERGQWIGRLGQTGNAEGTPPHVHVELRAPFRIPVREGGRNRRIDAFDPYPSLVAADPKRQE